METKQYPPNDDLERRAVDILNYLFDPSVVKAEINKVDKLPHHDGEIEIVDSERHPIGKFNVQVKKLPDDFKDRYNDCPVELIEYSRRIEQAFIFIGVNNSEKKAYWKVIEPSMVNELKKGGQKTFTLIFDKINNVIEESNPLYLSKWKEFILDRQRQREDLLRIKLLANELHGLESIEENDRIACQSYIDQINTLLSSDFSVIKETYFPNVWKLGMAIHKIDSDWVHYDYFSKQLGSTVGEVISLKGQDLNKIFEKGPQGYLAEFVRDENVEVLSSAFVRRNYFQANESAKNFISNQVRRALTERIFLPYNELQCIEEITTFLSRFGTTCSITASDNYDLREVNWGIREYLPVWFHLSIQKIRNGSSSLPFIKLDSFEMLGSFNQNSQIIDSNLIRENVGKISNNLTAAIITYLPIRIVLHSIEFLLSKGVNKIEIPYENYSTNGIDLQAVERIVTKIFANAGKAYNDFIKGNRLNGLIKGTYFGNDHSSIYEGDTNRWGNGSIAINEIVVEDPERTLPKMQYIRVQDSHLEYDFRENRTEATFKGKKYKVSEFSIGRRNYLLHAKPLKNQLYEMLAQDLSEVYGFKFPGSFAYNSKD